MLVIAIIAALCPVVAVAGLVYAGAKLDQARDECRRLKSAIDERSRAADTYRTVASGFMPDEKTPLDEMHAVDYLAANASAISGDGLSARRLFLLCRVF